MILLAVIISIIAGIIIQRGIVTGIKSNRVARSAILISAYSVFLIEAPD